MEERLKRLDLWRMGLGLYPIPLFSRDSQNDQFVLLNGNRGNFCLDLRNTHLSDESRSNAWSSNVGHSISLVNGEVEVQRWDQKRQAIERYDSKAVLHDLEKFHLHLQRDEPRRELSVISHSIRVFRSLRTALGSETDGSASLKAFLYLLAVITANVERGHVNTAEWGLDQTAAEVASVIESNHWDSLLSELVNGRPIEGLVPIPELVLRHASGQLFQEAHYEAITIPQDQMMLSGFAPRPITVGKRHKGFGLHFTPPALARTLVEEALTSMETLPNSITVFDPACGSGEFLREALRQLTAQSYRGRITLLGWDVSPAACDMAKFLLSWERRSVRNPLDIQIEYHDSILTEAWPRNIDLVAMNPPFVSWQDMTEAQKDAMTTLLGRLTNYRPDMASGFLLRAADTLTTRGVLASILPASFLDSDSAAPVRKRLSEVVNTKLVGRLGSHQLFMSATVDAALFVGTSAIHPNVAPLAFWADHRPQSASAGLRALRRVRYAQRQDVLPVLETGFNIYANEQLRHPEESWAPRPYEAWQLTQKLGSFPKVRDIFDVKQGVRTGLNKAFILSKGQMEKLPKGERVYFRPAVLNESINDGALDDSAWVFYPYGESLIQSEAELRSKLSSYYDRYLLPNKQLLSKRGSRRKAKWWQLSEHRTWQEKMHRKIVSTYFGGAGSFAWDSGGSFVIVQGFGWLSNSRMMSSNVAMAYVAILNSDLFSKLLSATSNHVGGGQWNLSKRFVQHIPLPDLLSSEADPDLIHELQSIGKDICLGQPVNFPQREELVRAAYGLDDSL